MIRHRWRKAEGVWSAVSPGFGAQSRAEFTTTEKQAVLHSDNVWRVLQYSAMTNPEEIGLQPAIWSDWMDVPVED